MSKRRIKRATRNDEQELVLGFDVTTGLPALTVEPRTTPIPDKPRRRGRTSRKER